MSDAFDAVSDLLDKQLFSHSKSDIVTNVSTDPISHFRVAQETGY